MRKPQAESLFKPQQLEEHTGPSRGLSRVPEHNPGKAEGDQGAAVSLREGPSAFEPCSPARFGGRHPAGACARAHAHTRPCGGSTA